jgi:hypothetical protein
MRKITKRTVAVSAAAALAVGGLGAAAFAGWFGGSATVSASTVEAVDISATLTPSGALFPGAQVNLTGPVTNPNSYGVRVTGITIGNLTRAGATPIPVSCNSASEADITVDAPADWVVPAGESPQLGTVLRMGANADDSCEDIDDLRIAVTLQGKVVGAN